MPNKHRVLFITRPRDSKEDRDRRNKAAEAHKDTRSLRRQRLKGLPESELYCINGFRSLGFDYVQYGKDCFQQVPKKLERTRVDRLPGKALDFLADNFNVVQVEDKQGQKLLHFLSKKEKAKYQGDEPLNLIKALVEKSEVPRKSAKAVYEALLETVKEELKTSRRIRLPGLCVIGLRYRPAREKGIRPDPFHPGQTMKVKPRKASNKLRINALKDLKEHADKLPVIAPPPKKKDKDKKKKKKK